MQDKNTDELLEILNNSHTTQDLDHYVDQYLDNHSFSSVSAYLQQLMVEKNLLKSEVIKDSNIARTYGYQLLNGDRQPSRDKLLALCIGMQLSLEETQRALTIAKIGVLHPRRKKDSICIYAIKKQLNVLHTNTLLFEMQESILE